MGRVGSDMEVKFLPGVGPKRAELLKKELDVSTVGELLRVFPFRYIDRNGIDRSYGSSIFNFAPFFFTSIAKIDKKYAINVVFLNRVNMHRTT